MKATWILTAALFLWACDGSDRAALSCQNYWNTGKFFKRAGVADVCRCLDADEKVDERDNHGTTPLHHAAAHSDTSAVLDVLLDAGAKVDARNNYGETPLHWAVDHSDTRAIFEVLIAAGANVDAPDMFRATPLGWAEKDSVAEEMLIAAGAKVNEKRRKCLTFGRPWKEHEQWAEARGDPPTKTPRIMHRRTAPCGDRTLGGG